jgi:hypothetical protein
VWKTSRIHFMTVLFISLSVLCGADQSDIRLEAKESLIASVNTSSWIESSSR